MVSDSQEEEKRGGFACSLGCRKQHSPATSEQVEPDGPNWRCGRITARPRASNDTNKRPRHREWFRKESSRYA